LLLRADSLPKTATVYNHRRRNTKYMSEQREYKRALLISYLDIQDATIDKKLGYVVDISHGGMMLISKNPIPIGTNMSLVISVPEEIDQTKAFNITAKSIQSTKDEDLDYFNTGFRFNKLTSADIRILDNIVAAFEL